MALTRQKVHAILRKAGLTKTRANSTRIRGWRDRIAGYDVREEESRIVVLYRVGSYTLAPEERARRQIREADKYMEALKDFGPVLDTTDTWDGPRVVLNKFAP